MVLERTHASETATHTRGENNVVANAKVCPQPFPHPHDSVVVVPQPNLDGRKPAPQKFRRRRNAVVQRYVPDDGQWAIHLSSVSGGTDCRWSISECV